MSALTKILTGAAGLVAVVGVASPAAAQGYPYNYNYGNNGGVLGAIIQGVTGGSGYGYNGYISDRQAVDQCAAAVNARLNGGYGNYGGGYGGGYGNYGGGYGNYGYNNNNAGGRVQQITRVERRSNGGFKVYGFATAGGNYGSNYGGYGNYGYNSGAQYRFNCKVDARGRVSDVDLDRNTSGYGYRRY